jgi:hypothetical protein
MKETSYNKFSSTYLGSLVRPKSTLGVRNGEDGPDELGLSLARLSEDTAASPMATMLSPSSSTLSCACNVLRLMLVILDATLLLTELAADWILSGTTTDVTVSRLSDIALVTACRMKKKRGVKKANEEMMPIKL